MGIHWSLAIDRFGRAVVAWDENDKSYPYSQRGTVHVARYEAGQWVRLGSSLNYTPVNTYAVAENPSLGVDPFDGSPSVAWIDESRSSSDRGVFVARWSDSSGTWNHITDNGLDGWDYSWTDAYGPSLATGRDGSLVVAWNERAGQSTPHFIRRWDGSQWLPFASSPHAMASNNYFVDSALALDARDQPVLMTPFLSSRSTQSGFCVRHFVP